MAGLVELFLGSTAAPVDWEAEAYPTYGDFAVLPLLVAFFPAVRFLLDRLVFEVISCLVQVSWIRNARAKLRHFNVPGRGPKWNGVRFRFDW